MRDSKIFHEKIQAYYDGDVEVLGDLGVIVREYARNICWKKRYADAEEIANEVVLKFLIGLQEQKYQTHLSTLGNYFYKMTVFTNYTWQKKNMLNNSSFDEEYTPNKASVSLSHEQDVQEYYSHYKDALKKLPDKYRIPLKLYYYRGMSCKEIATQMNTTDKYIKKKLYLARIQLKEEINKYVDEPIEQVFS